MALSIAQFLDRLRDSELLAPGEIESLAQKYPEKNSADSDQLTRELVNCKTITPYQVSALLGDRGRTLVLGEYVILREIGAGGMGKVFQVRHRRMDRLVALKVLPDSLTQNEAALKRFEREMRAAARLSHPNVVAAYDASEDKGVHYLVMEYVAGDDLANLVQKHGPFSVKAALDYTKQAAVGLLYAHSQGVIHRDIKPANLLLDRRGTVKILDLGLARFDAETEAADALTKTGSLMGTADYMSPEQALDTKNADVRADVYSLGCTLFYLLTGRTMYQGDTFMKRVVAHREEPIPNLAAARSDLPEGLQAVFEKMVAKKPKDRYQNMEELHTALAAVRLPKGQAVAKVGVGVTQAEGAGEITAVPASTRPSNVIVQADLATHASAGSVRLEPPAPAPSKPASRAKTALVLVGAGVVLLSALALPILVVVSIATRGVPNKTGPITSPSEIKTDAVNTGPSVESLADKARSEALAARRSWQKVESELPELLLPAETARAAQQWNTAQAAMASQDFSTARAGYTEAAQLFSKATNDGEKTRELYAAAQAQLKLLSDKRRAWQGMSANVAPGKALTAAAKADEAFQTIQARAGQLDALASIPAEVASAIRLYDEAISAAKTQAAEVETTNARAAADDTRKAWQPVADTFPALLHPPEAAAALTAWKAAESARASQDYPTAQLNYSEAARLFGAARAAGEVTRKLHAAAQTSLKELTARHDSWHQISKDIPPAKLPPSARQAETAFRDAQASADKVDTLVFVPQRVTAAIKLYDTAEASIRADRFDPAVRAATIAPYLDEKTVAIVHFDPARIDVAAAVDRIAEIWRPTPQETAELMAFVKNSQTQLDTFAKAGGRDIYAVATSESSQAYLIATIREGGDPLAIARALKKDDGFEAAEQVGNVVFAGSKSTLEKLKAARAAPRPELVKAFEAAGDTSAQLVVLPTPEMRQGLSAFSADSAGAKLAADGLQWLAVGLNAPPKLSVLLTIQMKDAASAAALSKLITSLVELLGIIPDVRKEVPKFDDLVKLLTPVVKGDRLTVTLDQESGSVTLLLAALGQPIRSARAAARQAQSTFNLTQLGLAMHNYHRDFGKLPAAASYSKEGKPLLSWRVHLLPYVSEGVDLHKQFRLDEPWDSVHNKKLIAKMPKIFESPFADVMEPGTTTYLAPIAPGSVFGAKEGTPLAKIVDGTSNTVLLVETRPERAVIWTRPDDLAVDLKKPQVDLISPGAKGVLCAFCDGTAKLISDKIDAASLKALLTFGGGEKVDPSKFFAP